MLLEYHDAAMHYALSNKPLTQNYPLADPDCHEAAQSAVFSVVYRHLGDRLPPPTVVDGRLVYHLRSPDGFHAQLFLLRLGAQLVSLELTPRMPLVDVARQRPLSESAQFEFAYIFACCNEAIIEFVRTATTAQGYDPPPPPADVSQYALWARMYAPGKSDKQLADEYGIAISTLRNARSELGIAKRPQQERTPRGKQNK